MKLIKKLFFALSDALTERLLKFNTDLKQYVCKHEHPNVVFMIGEYDLIMVCKKCGKEF